MKRLKNAFYRYMNNSSLSKSLNHFFFVMWFIPYLLISVILITVLSSTMAKKQFEIVQSSLEITQNTCNKILTDIHNFSDRIYVNRQLQNVILTKYDNIQDIYTDYTSISFMNDYLQDLDAVSSFRIYVDNETLLDNAFILKTTPKIREEEWYNVAIRMNGQPFWIYKTDSVNKKEYLALVRSIWRLGQYVGVLVINVNPDFVQMGITTNLFDTQIIYNNSILYSSNSSIVKGAEEDVVKLAKNQIESKHALKRVKINNEYYGVSTFKLYPKNTLNLSFLIMFMTPYKDLIRVTRNVTIITIVLMAILGCISLIFVKALSDYFRLRVSKINKNINLIVSNNFDIEPSIGGNDEFEQIYNSLYKMSLNLKSLIDQVYRQNLEKELLASRQNEIRYKMLATQINPHFLFNTLETIRMKSLAANDREVAHMLKLLASLLRYNLSISGKPISFYDELNSIQNYLTIQHIRFGNRISYDIVPLCDIQNILILPLLIQPIVENSFSHGLEDTTENGFIYILAEIQKVDGQEILSISMKDNGCGIPKDKLEILQKKLENPESEDENDSIGIFNVNARIKLFYGQQYGLSIKSIEGQGTTVTLHFPVIYTSNIIPKFQKLER